MSLAGDPFSSLSFLQSRRRLGHCLLPAARTGSAGERRAPGYLYAPPRCDIF